MLHICTPLFRYENLNAIYDTLPTDQDVTWHIAKTNKRQTPVAKIWDDPRVKIYDVSCEDADMTTKRNTIFDNIKDGVFCLLDDDTIFHMNMYFTYKLHENFVGMIIGKQYNRLHEGYPQKCKIDTGNVLCHFSILEKVRWPRKEIQTRDYVFWKNCFDIFGKEKCILVKDVISRYNYLRRNDDQLKIQLENNINIRKLKNNIRQLKRK